MITMDYEIRSPVMLRGSNSRGSWVYSEHPLTQPICLAYSLGETDEPKVWIPDWVEKILAKAYDIHEFEWLTDNPVDLFEAIENGDLVEAHNSFFERVNWNHISVPRYNWPEIAHEQWRCSAARAASLSLPRKMEKLAQVLGVKEQKDLDGHKTMLKITKPRKPLKAERDLLGKEIADKMVFWHEIPEEYMKVIEYCRQDVRTERSISKKLGSLPKVELKIWQVDQTINMRGMAVDINLAKIALEIEAVEKQKLEKLAAKASNNYGLDGETIRLSQRDKIRNWILAQGVDIPNMQAGTLEDFLKKDIPEHVKTVIECKKDSSKTAIKKYDAIMRMHGSDKRIHDHLMYAGAGPGRWTGRGVQTQNLIRGKMIHPEITCQLILDGDFDMLELILYGPQKRLDLIAWSVRGAFIASEGRDLIAGDYASIEARGVMWLAHIDSAIKAFQAGQDIYVVMAAEIFGVPVESIDKNTQDGAFKRFVGKQAVLGLGYNMGWKKFIAQSLTYGITIEVELAKLAVKTYREKYSPVVDLWHELEKSAIKAVKNPGIPFKVSYVTFIKKGMFLYCILPVGRPIAYFDPKVKKDKTPWGTPTDKLTYMTTVTGGKWVRTDTYGGKMLENVCQGTCRDIMASAVVDLEHNSVYDPVNTVHDEAICEVDEDKGSIEEFESILCKPLPWAKGFPIAASAWRGKRYRKD